MREAGAGATTEGARFLLGRSSRVDYRAALFQEFCDYLGGGRPRRILETGPKDGEDTRGCWSLLPTFSRSSTCTG